VLNSERRKRKRSRPFHGATPKFEVSNDSLAQGLETNPGRLLTRDCNDHDCQR
jgi:hypothetical protein